LNVAHLAPEVTGLELLLDGRVKVRVVAAEVRVRLGRRRPARDKVPHLLHLASGGVEVRAVARLVGVDLPSAGRRGQRVAWGAAKGQGTELLPRVPGYAARGWVQARAKQCGVYKSRRSALAPTAGPNSGPGRGSLVEQWDTRRSPRRA
jgi:hypothetical protein